MGHPSRSAIFHHKKTLRHLWLAARDSNGRYFELENEARFEGWQTHKEIPEEEKLRISDMLDWCDITYELKLTELSIAIDWQTQYEIGEGYTVWFFASHKTE